MNSKSTVWVGTEKSKLRKRIKVSVNGARIDAYLLVRTTFHGRSSSTRLEGHSGSMLRIWRRYASGSIPFRRQVPAFLATSRNLSAEAGIRGKNALPGHESPGHWSSNQSRFSQHGTNIFVKSWLREAGAHNVLVTSAVNNNGVTELFALLHTEEGCC